MLWVEPRSQKTGLTVLQPGDYSGQQEPWKLAGLLPLLEKEDEGS